MPAVATTGGVLDAGSRSSAVDQPTAEQLSDRSVRRRPAGLVSFIGAKAPLITPSVVIAVTVIICLLYIDPTRLANPDELFLYTVVGLAICLLALCLAALRACAHDANSREYHELRIRLDELEAQLEVLQTGSDDRHQNPTSLKQALCDAARLRLMLDSIGPEWPSGNGYLGAWKLLHRAEEALLEVSPCEAVVAAGINDALRLSGSSIEHGDQLTSKLNAAVKFLSQDSFQRYLDSSASSVAASHGNAPSATTQSPAPASHDAQAPADPADCCPHCMAKSVLRDVRAAIDEFRDNSRAGLLRARNVLLATLTFTTLGTFSLTGVAVIDDAGRPVVGAAAAYFALGAVVGLFNRLRIASRTSNNDNPLDVEDYGLTWARAMAAPIFSGLAAVIGVFVISQLQISIAGIGLVSAQALPVAAEASRPPDISQVFNLHSNSFGLLLAAVFGTAPELVTGYLQKPAEDLKRGLKNSASSGGKTT